MVVSVYAFLQARMSSTRLPGKVLMDLAGSPMLIQQINRLKRSNLVDEIVVLTSDTSSDNVLFQACKNNDIECFRGSLDNVLDRYYQAYKEYLPDHIVRITADCPLLNWDVVDRIVQEHFDNENDYTTNTIIPSYPDGLDVEVMTKECLIKMKEKASLKTELEHVTYYCYTHIDEFKIQNVENEQGDKSLYRWTVDTPEDFELIEEVYAALYETNHAFNSDDVFNYLLENPEVSNKNALYKRNEGLEISLLGEQDHE